MEQFCKYLPILAGKNDRQSTCCLANETQAGGSQNQMQSTVFINVQPCFIENWIKSGRDIREVLLLSERKKYAQLLELSRLLPISKVITKCRLGWF